jgi:hypothetical protein
MNPKPLRPSADSISASIASTELIRAKFIKITMAIIIPIKPAKNARVASEPRINPPIIAGIK